MITLALVLVLVAWLALPFVPALQEAFRARDDGALPISDLYVEDLARPIEADAPAMPAEAPGSTIVEETFAGTPGLVADEVRVRADVQLAAGTEVRRRVAAGTTLDVDPGSVLLGSAEAGERVRLATGVRFERVHAPVVEVGEAAERPEPARPPAFEVNPGVELLAGRALVSDDLAVPPRGRLSADLVVTGDLVVGAGAVVEGDVKAHGDVVLEAGARVTGNVFASRSLTLGAWAEVDGAAVAEGTLRLARGARVGRPDVPSTATGRCVVVAAGARVYGTLWAVEDGHTVDELEDSDGAGSATGRGGSRGLTGRQPEAGPRR